MESQKASFQSDAIRVEKGEGGLDCIRLSWRDTHAVIYLQGAHVAEYYPDGKENVLWVSESSLFGDGKAIRGGIPLCWPWFGASPDSRNPQHGYARQALFQVASTALSDLSSAVVLKLNVENIPDKGWYRGLDLEIEFVLSDSLWMEMRTQNTSKDTQRFSSCFHNYFYVEHISQIEVPALQSLTYLDKLRDFNAFEQAESFSVGEEVDRIYRKAGSQILLNDLKSKREIIIETWGLEDLVAWNPWATKAKQMQDFEDLGYQHMLCLEPANALLDSVEILPGEVHRSGQRIRLAG